MNGDAGDCTSTVSRRLRNLQNAGVLSLRSKRYLLSDSCGLQYMSDKELLQIYYLAAFFALAGRPRIPAAYVRNAIRRQLRFRGMDTPPEAFLIRDNACGNLLDEQLVYRIAACCRMSRKVRLRLRGRELDVEPVSFRVDKRFGRWYLMARRDGLPLLIRVSNIERVTMLGETFNGEQAQNMIRRAFCGGGVSGNRNNPVSVEAELCFDNANIRRQFEREIVLGRIERRGEREFYIAKVNDATELRPLLRAYGPWVRVLPGEGHRLDAELRAEYERMLHKYGDIS